MTFYLSIVIIVGILMLAMSIHVLRYSGFNKVQKTWFIVTFASIFFCSLAEYAAHSGYYHEMFKIPLTILTVIQFSIAPVLGMLFSGALGLKYQGRIAIGYFGLGLLSEIICVPFGWIFFYGDSGYTRGPAFLVYELFYVGSLVYLVVALILVGKKFQHRDSSTIIMILAVLIAGIIPMTFYKLNVTYLAVGIASSLCYIFYNDLVQEDTKLELVANQKRVSDMQQHIIVGMASLIENRDAETGDHVIRTSKYVHIIAVEAKKRGVYTDILTDHYIELLTALAPMHDVGKIVVPDHILKKTGWLSDEEYAEMKKHAEMGGTVIRQILSGITDEEYFTFASDIATYHHERWDGSGYPYGLKGEEIPLSARIMAIADVYDALVSERCYKTPMSVDEAFDLIKNEAGTHFDPKLVEVFLDIKKEIIE